MPKLILFIFEMNKLKIMIDTTPLFTDDTIVFGLLMSAIALIFYTESRPTGFWHKFYKIVPGLFMAYMIPALFTTLGWIAPEWETLCQWRINTTQQ